MSLPSRASAVAVVLTLTAAGCQDYNFNPVGHCMIQPGTQRFTLSSVSSADVLFVVDDSGSMGGEQTRLAAAFGDFVQNLTSTNAGRAQAGLVPIDFHVAVTTTSVYYNGEPTGSTQTCLANCGVAGSEPACCTGGTTPVYGPRACSGPTASCPVAGTSCRNTCDGFLGEYYCCSNGGAGPVDSFPENAINSVGGSVVRCSLTGVSCGTLETHYAFRGQCAPGDRGVAIDGMPFPDGDLVGVVNTGAVTANPRVLHFDRRLYQAVDGRNAQGFDRAQLEAFFQQNVRVGICGSLQEQGLRASRRALERALAGQLKDTYTYNRAAGFDPNSTPATQLRFTAPNGIPTPDAPLVWPNPASKLVLVYIGDEDDCSAPEDRSAGVVMLDNPTLRDSCADDILTPAPFGEKQTSVASFVDYFTGLGRPVGAAFIVSAVSSGGSQTSCTNDSCVPGTCCDFACTGSAAVCSTDTCGGQAPGSRFLAAATALEARGADVVAGSVCDDFSPLLDQVAEIVKPPRTLDLPTLPAESAVAMLRIADASGTTRLICRAPLAPRPTPNYTLQEAENTGADWWFSEKADPPGPPFDPSGAGSVAVPTKFVYINPKGSCIANPGETYSADYLGVVPQPPPNQPLQAGGCDPAIGAVDCQAKLGGAVTDWTCTALPGITPAWGTCNCGGGT